MNKIVTAALALTLFCTLLLSGCGSSSTTATSANGSSLVTVSIGGTGKVASLKVRPATLLARAELKLQRAWREGLAYAAPFPDSVKKFRVTVTAADMQPGILTLNLPSGSEEATGSFEVPNGIARVFTGELLNLDNKPVYRKISEPYNLSGNPVTIAFSGWEVTAPLGTVIVIGTVSDSTTGAPLTGATVTFGSNPPVTTSPIGMYYSEMAPGTYNVTVDKSGYNSSNQRSEVIPSPTGEFVVIDVGISPKAVAQ